MNRRAVFSYIVGQAFGLVGVWMHLTMLSALALRISGSPLWLGFTLAAYSLPTLLFSWFIGPMLARLPAKIVLIGSQAVNAAIMLVYALLLALNQMTLEPLFVLAFLSGTIYAIDLPCKQIILTRLFGDERLMQAIALNSIVFNGARIAGPLLASLFMVLAELSWGFAVNALLFAIGLCGLLPVSLPPEHSGHTTAVRHEPKASAALHSRPQVMRVLRAGERGSRARLASVYNMLLNGFVPLGNMLAGILLHYLGVSRSFYLISASVLLFLAVWLASNGLRGGEHWGRR